MDYLETSHVEQSQFVDLLQCYHIADESALYVFNTENLKSYMTGHSHTSYLSFFYEDYYIMCKEKKNNLPISDSTVIETIKKPIGCISSRTVDFTILKGKKIVCYFLDFICVKRNKQDEFLSRNLIQTHEFRQRTLNLNNTLSNKNSERIAVSIFKKEVDLCKGIVPLVEYDTKMWRIQNEPIKKLPDHFVLIEIGEKNIDLLIDFIEMSKTKYHCFGIAELGNLSGLIQKRILSVYCIQKGNDVYAAYFFRDSRTQYEDKGVMLILCGSIHNSNSADMFYMGFLRSIRAILDQTPIFQVLMIENISHNTIIYERYSATNVHSFGETMAAYYLYNYVVPKQPFQKENIFMVF